MRQLVTYLAPQPVAPIAAGWEMSLADIANEVGDEWKNHQAVDSLFGDASTLVPESLASRTTGRLPLARGRHA